MEITTEQIIDSYAGGIDCSQVVFGHGAELIGFDKETAIKIAAAFGGGMFAGERCGCVTGALMAIGLKYGHYKRGDKKAKDALLEKKAEFEKAFIEEHGSLVCKELLEHDLTIPEEMAKIMEENLLMTLCPVFALTACDILEEIL